MITIDIMTENDISGVYMVECASFLTPWSEKMFSDDLKNPHTVYVTAKDDEKIIGYAGVWCVAGDADITNVAVLKEYRRCGIASRILERLILEAKKRESENIRLEVRESNLGAISLYEKFGFKKIDVRKKYYQDNGEDALIMEKKINLEEK